MSCHFINRQELLQIAEHRYYDGEDNGKDKAAEYYIINKEVLKENAKNKYRNLSEEKRDAKREYERNRYRNMRNVKKDKLKEYQRKYQATKIIRYYKYKYIYIYIFA